MAQILVSGHRICLSLAREGDHGLSPGERAAVDLVGRGLGNKGIARRLGVSRETVKTVLHRAFRKLGVHSRAELARVATLLGLVPQMGD